MVREFCHAVELRRSIYALTDESVIENEKIKEIIEHSIKYAPSAFNSQSARVMLLLNEHHDHLWDIIKDVLFEITGGKNFEKTTEKLQSFKDAYGTVVFFEDMEVVSSLQQRFPLYADHFPEWSLQSSGMLQFIIWTALETAGFGASLQHYNPVIDNAVKSEWGIPETWKLISQMPFGKPYAPAGEKTFEPMEKRFKIFE